MTAREPHPPIALTGEEATRLYDLLAALIDPDQYTIGQIDDDHHDEATALQRIIFERGAVGDEYS